MILFPNAKINLGLYITRRRPDGYHDILTAMMPVPWCDVLEIVPAKGVETTLTVTGRTVECPPEKNLVMKAFRAVEREVALPPVDIYLRKIIPDGAGLGGGSADAAFTIKGLDALLSLDLGDERMEAIAATVGADCPFFIRNTPALAEGIGTELTPIPLDLSGKYIVIVKPHVGVSTAQAYSGVTPCAEVPDIKGMLDSDISSWQKGLKNRFEESVGALCPEIMDIKRRLMESGAVYVSMSGSGSAVYAIYESDILSYGLQRQFEGCDFFASKL